MKPRRKGFWIAALTALSLNGCDFLDTLWERIQVLSVNFSFDRLDVSGLVYPSLLETSQDIFSLDVSNRSKYGVNVRCRIKADNPNKHAAAFDGAQAFLRAGDTSTAAKSISATLPAFRIEAGKGADLDIVFPVRLDDPLFTYDTWTRLVRGDSLPYRLSADLFFRLLDDGAPESIRELGNKTVPLNLARGSVDAAETGTAVLDLILAYLRLYFGF